MDRTEFLEMCRKVAVLPSGIKDIRNTPPSLWVKYNDMTFYPVGYKLTFDKYGQPMHTAILHDLKANSVINCDLSKVERMCEG